MRTHPRPYKVLDLFSGAGGFSLGFELVKDSKGNKIFETVAAVDNDHYACGTFKRNFRTAEVIEGDITKKSVHNRIVSKCRDKIDIIVGGPPCQSFSTIGPRSGFGVRNRKFRKDKRDKLYLEFVRLVREIKPKFVVVENVRGILSKKDGKGSPYINKIIRSLERTGYSFELENGKEKYQILNAIHFGVPQRRQRVFVIGNRIGVRNPVIKRTHYDSEHDETVSGLKKGVILREAIGDLPPLKAKITFTDLKRSEIERIRKLNKMIESGYEETDYHISEIIRHNEFLHFVSSGPVTGERPDTLRDHKARQQQFSDIKLFGLMRPGETAKEFINNGHSLNDKKLIKYDMSGFFDKYRKQKWSAPCTTIFAHLEKDGNRFIHPDKKQARTFTVREAARVQSFPDDFVFEGPYNKRFRQIGNAVPPLLAYAVALSICSFPENAIK